MVNGITWSRYWGVLITDFLVALPSTVILAVLPILGSPFSVCYVVLVTLEYQFCLLKKVC